MEDQNVISAESWRAWAAKDRKHNQAIARKIKLTVGVVIGLLTLAGAFYFSVAR